MLKPKVALSQDFLSNLAKLPASVHSKVLKWAIRFQSDPTASGINYEKIKGARDSNLKSVRIDQDWRGVVFKPDQGDLYILLYVDHHDDAYRWAENRKLAVNPVTGAMQIVILEETPIAVQAQALTADAVASTAPLFAQVSDYDLLSVGTPEEMIARVRGVRNEADLDALQAVLPVEAYEGLFLVAAGDTVGQILTARETLVNRSIDVGDFAGALATPESQARFFIVDDDAALTAVMNAPLAQWRVFLHPTQKRLAIGDRSGPVRVLGGAGTGKTVVAMHRAKWLAENRSPDGKRVLFTTFTKNLAIDIEENLKSLCSPQTMERIDVRNLDSWVHALLRSQRYEHRIVYGRSGEAAESWQRALAVKNGSLGLSDEFYVQELEQVVLAQGVTTLDEYRGARRVGRGVILSRSKRDAIWPVFEEYRAQLASRKLKEVDDAYRDAAALIEASGGVGRYSAIVVDETQDFGPQALRLLRTMIAQGQNDLFFVGDGHQRIYARNRAAMSRCGINIRGRARKLYLNYRTTEEIRKEAVAILEGCTIDDLDEGHDENRRYKSLSHGPSPARLTVESFEEALKAAHELLKQWQATGGTCVITPRKNDRDEAERFFGRKGFATHIIEANERDVVAGDALRFATMHRAKGLEFEQTIVIGRSSMLGPVQETANDRRLVYVALTRAKQRAALIVC